MSNFLDIANQRFGRLIAIERLGTKWGQALWRCVCDCGNELHTTGYELRTGVTRSCGCFMKENQSRLSGKKTHGKSRTSGAYKSWVWMRSRCRNPNHVDYPRYGGRGIDVAQEWLDFDVFFKDMGERPPGHSLDRKDVDGMYCRDNCRWATSLEQASNKRNTVFYEVDGVRLPLTEWSRRLGVCTSTLRQRLKKQKGTK